jgi:hypothetical protein
LFGGKLASVAAGVSLSRLAVEMRVLPRGARGATGGYCLSLQLDSALR